MYRKSTSKSFTNWYDTLRTTVTLAQPLKINVMSLALASEMRYYGPEDSFPNREMLGSSNNSKPIFLSFKNKTEDGFHEITSDYSGEEIASYLLTKNVPLDLFTAVKEALLGTDLAIPEMSADKVNQFKLEEQKALDKKRLIIDANSRGKIYRTGNFTPEIARGILQSEVIITTAKSKQPIIATFGAGPCVIVAFYNPDLATAGIAHIDALTNANSLTIYLDIVKGESNSRLQVHLYGGSPCSEHHVIKLLEILNNRNDIDLLSCNLINIDSSEDLAIDSRTGEVFTEFNRHTLDLGSDLSSKISTIATRTRRSDLMPIFIGTPMQDVIKEVRVSDMLSIMRTHPIWTAQPAAPQNSATTVKEDNDAQAECTANVPY